MSNKYQYTKLATASNIRVIKVEEPRVDNKVACVIRNVEQSDFEYYALSYVWGDPTPTKQIYLGDGFNDLSLYAVHESLWRFLNWAWDRKIFERWIWTDRICLDQEDTDEMAQQIPRMGEIFHNAKQVMAWLGMSESEGDCVANHINWSVTSAQRHSNEFRHQISPQTLRAIQKAYGNEYWERVWIVQEVVTAKSLVVLIGNIEVSPNAIEGDCNLVGQERGDRTSLPDFPIYHMLRLRSSGRRSELAEVLAIITDGVFRCGRPQDRVYGGLGLLASRADGTSPADFIGVDYSRSYPEILLDAILETRLLHVTSLEEMLCLLLSRSQMYMREPTFDLFKRYLENDKTSKRHKWLAGRALQACDAFNTMFLLSGCRPGCPSYCYLLGQCLAHSTEFNLTARDNAALLGLSLGLGIFRGAAASTFEHWKASRKPPISSKPPWRCTTHRAHKLPGFAGSSNADHALEELAGTEIFLRGEMKGKFDIWCWQPFRLMKACAGYCPDSPQSCDASTMTFEMPEGDFRVTLRHSPGGREYFYPKIGIPKVLPIGCECVDPGDEEYVSKEGCYGEMVLQFLNPGTDRDREGSSQNGD